MWREETMEQLGILVFRYRKFIILIWVLIIGILSFYAVKLPSALSGNGFEYNGEYNRTREILEEEFGHAKSTIILLFQKEANADQSEWDNYIVETFNEIESLPLLEGVITPFDQEDMMKGNYAYGLLLFEEEASKMGEVITELRHILKNKETMSVSITGEPVIVKDLNEASQKDLAKAEMIGLPIALVVLILAFGSLIAAGLPLLIGIVSISTTMGAMYFFSHEFTLSVFILNIVPMIGLALSIDFALLLINRFKEEIDVNPLEKAISHTIATAGRAIIFSGLCVFIGLMGLLFIKIDIFQNVAIGGMTVVFISALAAITFLPAILGIIGTNINKFSVYKPKQNKTNIWYKFAELVMKRPIIMAGLALTLLISGLIPVKDMELTIPGTDSLPRDYESRETYETFQEQFLGPEKSDENKVVIVIKTIEHILELDSLMQAKSFLNTIEEAENVRSVESLFSATEIEEPEILKQLIDQPTSPLSSAIDFYTADDKMLLNVYLDGSISEGEAKEWVRNWSGKEYEIETFFGGYVKFEQEIYDEINDKVPYGLFVILVSTFIILMVAFRSILIPLKAIIMNVLSLSASFGITVWIFQEGQFGLEPVSIALILPVFVFSLVFGLSMDYEVFLISRIHEEYIETRDNQKATLIGLTSTSKIITSAAAIMIVITGAFAFTGVMPVKQMGVGIALAIFIDATIVRMVLVPSLMKLFGDWNWWFFGLKPKNLLGKH